MYKPKGQAALRKLATHHKFSLFAQRFRNFPAATWAPKWSYMLSVGTAVGFLNFTVESKLVSTSMSLLDDLDKYNRSCPTKMNNRFLRQWPRQTVKSCSSYPRYFWWAVHNWNRVDSRHTFVVDFLQCGIIVFIYIFWMGPTYNYVGVTMERIRRNWNGTWSE